MPQNDILSAEGIRPYLNDPSVSSGIAVYDSLASTNRTAKEIASEGGGKIFAVIADGQTDGKGRAKKPFFSPPKSGLYLSLILSPERYAFENLTDVTVVAAAAVCLSIQKVCGIETAVKPVNDIFKDGKKVCGILTEAVVDLEGGTAEWIVVGIGLNVGASAFPPELKNIACSLYDTPLAGGIRNRLAAEILHQFGRAAEKDFFETMKQEYQKRLIVIR
jgi:BirA family biotin operon repressor/biotin-[acetyl-CoA-carboxylase] ligase